MSQTYRLIATCPDRVGIVAAASSFIARYGGWIVAASQHTDEAAGWFFMRYELLADSLRCPVEQFQADFEAVAAEFQMEWRLTNSAAPKRVVLLVSREDHCLADLLYRWRSRELFCDVAGVISNHESLRRFVEWHDIPYHHVPIPRDGKAAAFARIAGLLREFRADVVVLARFMQILPQDLCREYGGRLINIHHSFLPSFVGAKPYHQAYVHGVKLIGATCHYVTAELDTGPIIEQDVIRVNHQHRIDDLIRLGRDVEKTVLARGLRYHLEDRVLIHGQRTVVFA